MSEKKVQSRRKFIATSTAAAAVDVAMNLRRD